MKSPSRLRSLVTGDRRSYLKRLAERSKTSANRSLRIEPLEERKLLAVFNLIAGASDGATGSLREAISIANSNGEDDQINLAAGTYSLSLESTLEDNNASGDLDLTEVGKTLIIRGAGAESTVVDASISGQATDRVFHVLANVSAFIEGITITGGNTGYSSGGGILNDGNLTLMNVAVTGNEATDTSFLSNDGSGAGIHNTGNLHVSNSVVSDNTIVPTYGGWGWTKSWHRGQGGGISNVGAATITNSTVTNNTAGKGGGIYNKSTLLIGGNSITDNTPDNLLNEGGTVSILDAPTASDDGYAVDEDNTLSVAAPGVLANDSDSDGDTLSASFVNGPSDGTLTLRADGSFDYTPRSNFNGSDSFTYIAHDGTSASNLATVTIQVDPVNNAPIGVSEIYFVAPNDTLSVAVPGVLANDIDVDGDSLTAIQASTTRNGTLAFKRSGAFTYTPNPGFEGSDSFQYQADDGQRTSDTVTVTINVGTITVTTTTDEDDGLLGGGGGISLREAIRYTPANGVIDLPAGQYLLTRRGDEENAGATGDLDITRNLTLRGAGAATTIIDASPLATELSNGVLSGDRAFHVLPGVVGNIRGVTLTGGRPDASTFNLNAGGAVLNEGTLTIDGSTLTGNHSVGFASLLTSNGEVPTQLSGGAIHNTGDLTITDSTINENSVRERRRSCFGSFGTNCILSESTGGEGGGIWNSGEVTIVDSSITGNKSHNGGGISNKGTVSTTNAVLSGNEAIDFGGGIHSISTATDVLIRTMISGNSALYGGGVNTHGAITIVDSTFSNNAAIPRLGLSDGGGLLVQGMANATVTGSTFSGNAADLGGGIHVYSGGTLRAINSTISGNTASNYGGGIINRFSGEVTLTNVTVTNNSADSGGGLHVEHHPIVVDNSIVAENTRSGSTTGDDIAGEVQVRFSLVQSTRNTIFLDASERIINPSAANNITGVKPQFGTLQDNGGPTFTHELFSNSPAIDHGSNALAADGQGNPLTNDQRGSIRIVDNGGGAGNTIDMGAFEAALISLPPNNPPTAQDDTYMISAGTTLVINAVNGALANDNDADGDTLTAALQNDTAHGQLVFSSDGSFTYQPNAGFVGTDIFTYTANDGTANSTLATVSIEVQQVVPPSSSKFFVVDDAVDDTFKYANDGSSVGSYNLSAGNNSPRGAAATRDGSTVLVIDDDDFVYGYDAQGNSQGAWKANGLSRPEGIATDGIDVWIVDRGTDRVYQFSNAVSRRSGSQSASANFRLASGNSNPTGISTDGNYLWIVNSSRTDMVFKYTVGGTLIGRWTIDSRNASPAGITIDPADVNHIWIVDSGTNQVFQYSGAANRTSGGQSANFIFGLSAANRNPQGIVDPPTTSDGISPTPLIIQSANPETRIPQTETNLPLRSPLRWASFRNRQRVIASLRLSPTVPDVLQPTQAAMTRPTAREIVFGEFGDDPLGDDDITFRDAALNWLFSDSLY